MKDIFGNEVNPGFYWATDCDDPNQTAPEFLVRVNEDKTVSHFGSEIAYDMTEYAFLVPVVFPCNS